MTSAEIQCKNTPTKKYGFSVTKFKSAKNFYVFHEYLFLHLSQNQQILLNESYKLEHKLCFII